MYFPTVGSGGPSLLTVAREGYLHSWPCVLTSPFVFPTSPSSLHATFSVPLFIRTSATLIEAHLVNFRPNPDGFILIRFLP